MSSILKALRKLEEDKSALGEGSVDLGRDILKRSYRSGREGHGGLILSLAVLLAALVGGGLWWLQVPPGSEPPHLASTRGTAAADAPVPVQTPRTSTNQVESEPEKVASFSLIPPVDGHRRAAEVALPAPVRTTKNRVATPATPVAKAAQSSPAASPEIPQPPAASLQMPDLRIAEIVYQEQPEARMAVINDLPVMEGTVIDGAEVLEIFPDRVRFSLQGVQFEKFSTVAEGGPVNH